MIDDTYRKKHCSASIFDNLEELEETLNEEYTELPANINEAKLVAWLQTELLGELKKPYNKQLN